MQTHLKKPDTRFALTLNDQQLAIVEQLVWEEVKICDHCLEYVDNDEKKLLKLKIKTCREVLRKIEGLKEGAR